MTSEKLSEEELAEVRERAHDANDAWWTKRLMMKYDDALDDLEHAHDRIESATESLEKEHSLLRDVLAIGWDAVMGTGGPHFSEASRERVSFALSALSVMLDRVGGKKLSSLPEIEAARARIRAAIMSGG